MTYLETPADHDFTAFLAGLTPSKVLRDREPITTIERKRLRFMRERNTFNEAQLRVADEWAARQTA